MRELALGLRNRLGSYFWDNPIFLKELRLHFRSKRTYWVQGAYLVVIAILMTMVTSYVQLSAQSGGRAALWAVGQTMFRGLFSIHVMLVIVMLSSLAAGVITSEREARTYELLESLPLSKGRLVAGKFAALVLLTGLFMSSAMPILMVSLQFIGGVVFNDVLGAFLIILGLVGLTAALGVLTSSVSETYRSSLFLTYRILILIFVLSWGLRIFGAVSDPAAAYRGAGSSPMYQMINSLSNSGIFRSVPGLSIILWPLALLMIIMPSPTFSLKSSVVILVLCGGIIAPLLTGAAESLRPVHEKRPYHLLILIAILFHLLLGGFLVSSAASAPAAAAAAAMHRHVMSGTAGALPALDYLLMTAIGLFFVSVCALPAESKGFSGWRGFFSGGAAQGGLLLAACVLGSYLLWQVVMPQLLPAAAAAESITAAFVTVGTGELLLLAMIPLWAALAFLARRAFPAHSRQAYLGLQLIICVAPVIMNAALPAPTKALNAWLLGLNPWLLLATLDAPRTAAMAGMLKLPPMPSALAASVFSLALAAAAWTAGSVIPARKNGP